MALISDYYQPSFYRFNEDSITLANEAAHFIEKNQSVVKSYADFCCGCGVVLLEIIQKAKLTNGYFDFYEKQEDYKEYISKNISLFESSNYSLTTNIHIGDLLSISHNLSYDLIVMNPPYFKSGYVRSSSDINRRICREYEGDNFGNLIKVAAASLSENGSLFFVCREDQNIKKSLLNISKHYSLEKIRNEKSYSIFRLTTS